MLSIYLILPAALDPGAYLTSNLNKYLKRFLGTEVRAVREAPKLTGICEPNVYTMWDPSTFHNPTGLYGLLLGLLDFYVCRYNF
jgi:hypothetical protein